MFVLEERGCLCNTFPMSTVLCTHRLYVFLGSAFFLMIVVGTFFFGIDEGLKTFSTPKPLI